MDIHLGGFEVRFATGVAFRSFFDRFLLDLDRFLLDLGVCPYGLPFLG